MAPAFGDWPNWQVGTVACIATGPSLTAEQLRLIRTAGVRTIGINDIGLYEPWIDIWYASDLKFWRRYQEEAKSTKALKVTSHKKAMNLGVCDLLLDVDRTANGHSGIQALQLAVKLGASRILLVGYDCKTDDRKINYRPKDPTFDIDSDYPRWIQEYERMEIPDCVRILNCTPGSAITRFESRDLGAELQ